MTRVSGAKSARGRSPSNEGKRHREVSWKSVRTVTSTGVPHQCDAGRLGRRLVANHPKKRFARSRESSPHCPQQHSTDCRPPGRQSKTNARFDSLDGNVWRPSRLWAKRTQSPDRRGLRGTGARGRARRVGDTAENSRLRLLDATAACGETPGCRGRREASEPGRRFERKRGRVEDASGPNRRRMRSRAAAKEA